MNDGPGPIRRFYDGWQSYNARLIEAIRGLSDDQLQLRAAPDQWPIWATAAHLAGVRVYSGCAASSRSRGPRRPRSRIPRAGWAGRTTRTGSGAAELIGALQTTWALVAGCLERWTPEMLSQEFTREIGGMMQIHTRQSVIMRLISHDAYHCGEISQTLGVNGLPQIDLWRPSVA